MRNKAGKQLKSVPEYIQRKFYYWADKVQRLGIREVRKFKGFHDEPLMGKRFGQRSIRLSKSYRAIYRIVDKNEIELLEVLEVNKHEY